MYKFYYLFLTFLKLSTGGQIKLGIIGGKEANPHQFPYQALIYSTPDGQKWFMCGGSLISTKYVLTAAHCFIGKDNSRSEVDVYLGAHDVQKVNDPQVKQFKGIYIAHKKYNTNEIQKNDIALVRLSEPATISKIIQTVKLPSRADLRKSYKGYTVTVSGWGNISGNKTTNLLQYLNVNIIGNEECSNSFHIINSNICAMGKAANEKGGCSGDSGGALVYKGVQIGIVSYGDKTCSDKLPTVFTRVTSYLDWIEQNSDVRIL